MSSPCLGTPMPPTVEAARNTLSLSSMNTTEPFKERRDKSMGIIPRRDLTLVENDRSSDSKASNIPSSGGRGPALMLHGEYVQGTPVQRARISKYTQELGKFAGCAVNQSRM